jgi:hypothetical protein
MSDNTERTVWVVYADPRKNLRDAERFGSLKEVFSSVGKTYNTPAMLDHARRVLQDWQPGDMLLMVGDPTLCAVCMTVVFEIDPFITLLRWDRDYFRYIPQQWDFTEGGYEF